MRIWGEKYFAKDVVNGCLLPRDSDGLCIFLPRVMEVYRSGCMVHDSYWHVSGDRLGGFGVKNFSWKMFMNGCLLLRDSVGLCVFLHVQNWQELWRCTLMSTHRYTHSHIKTHTIWRHTYIQHVYTHTCIHTYMHTHIHAYINTHDCAHTHTQTHMHAYTHIHS